MKALIYLSAFLVLSSCGLFKNRTVQKDSYKLETATSSDSTALSTWKETATRTIQNDILSTMAVTDQYSWIIETDSGIIQVDPRKGFIGKAKSVRGTGTFSSNSTVKDQSTVSDSSSRAGENSIKTTRKAVIVEDRKTKAVESKPDYAWILWLVGIGFVLYVFLIGYSKYKSKLL